MRGDLRKMGACVTIAIMLLVVFNIQAPVVQADGPMGTSKILIVGGQDKMKSRNPLPAKAMDVWTKDVLDRVYDTVGKVEVGTEKLLPYIIKGIDADDNGTFDTDEYGVFAKEPGTDPLIIMAYYDFNGVYFHDGVQADVGDLFFSYQLQALNAQMNTDFRVLMDRAGKAGSNYTQTRWLYVMPTTKVWTSEPTVGNASLRVAVKFEMQEPFVLFNRSTLIDCVLFPRHVWEGTGWRLEGSVTVSPLHSDFGQAIYNESDSRFGLGVPTTDPQHFIYLKPETTAEDSAEEWEPTDKDVIGTGPFFFDNFDTATGIAIVLKNEDYYSGNDTKTNQSIDPFISTYIHPPYIDGITFRVFANATQGTLALVSGIIDFYHWSYAPEFLPTLMSYAPDIRVWLGKEPGFTYLSYNLRRQHVGTYHWGFADMYDTGLHFRRAIAHLTDKATIVDSYLQSYGIPGVVPVSPNNAKFYNSSLSGYAFSRALALQEIDLAHQDALVLKALLGPSAPIGIDDWYTYDTNKLILPGIGTAEFNLWCPIVDYDPVKANSCSMIATEMRDLGIQVKARPIAFSSIIQLINAHDFDMYMLDWRINTNDPDYLFDFFHSSNAAAGKNFGGFYDVTFDYVIEETRKKLNETERISMFKWAQQILLNKLPYDTLYFRTNIEADRAVCFEGWIQDFGTIWNYWSLLNVSKNCINHPPTASFTVYPPTGSPLTTFNFDASACTDPEDHITSLSVRWDFENDSVWDTPWSTVKTAQHQYPSAGTYTVRLEVRDSGLETNSTTRQVIVIDDTIPPTVSITYPVDGQVFNETPVTVIGTAADTGGTGLQRVEVRVNAGNWTNAMGTASWSITVPLVSGTNLIEARAWDNGALQSTIESVTVELNTWPIASFTISPIEGNTTTLFTFTSTSTDAEDPPSALSYRWDFEDDDTWDTSWSSSISVQHTFPHPGFYTIRLEVKDTGNLTNTTTVVHVVGLAAPFNLTTMTGDVEGTVRLSWEHPTPEDVVSYTVKVYESWNATVSFLTINVTPTTHPMVITIDGLEPGATYWFEVIAFNETVGESDPSTRISGVAWKAPPSDEISVIAVIVILVAVMLLLLIFLLLRRKKKGGSEEGEGKVEDEMPP